MLTTTYRIAHRSLTLGMIFTLTMLLAPFGNLPNLIIL